MSPFEPKMGTIWHFMYVRYFNLRYGWVPQKTTTCKLVYIYLWGFWYQNLANFLVKNMPLLLIGSWSFAIGVHLIFFSDSFWKTIAMNYGLAAVVVASLGATYLFIYFLARFIRWISNDTMIHQMYISIRDKTCREVIWVE